MSKIEIVCKNIILTESPHEFLLSLQLAAATNNKFSPPLTAPIFSAHLLPTARMNQKSLAHVKLELAVGGVASRTMDRQFCAISWAAATVFRFHAESTVINTNSGFYETKN